MSKSEANSKSEIRKKAGRTAIRTHLAGDRQSKPRRGCLFIDGAESSQASFCFSAARTHRNDRYSNWVGTGIGAHRYHSAAAEKQKEKKEEAGSGYKQGTPTGLGPKRRTAHWEIGSFEFRICFELRVSDFDFLPS
jgi:hypothetical protein